MIGSCPTSDFRGPQGDPMVIYWGLVGFTGDLTGFNGDFMGIDGESMGMSQDISRYNTLKFVGK